MVVIWTRSFPPCTPMSHPKPFWALVCKGWSISTLYYFIFSWKKEWINIYLLEPSSHSYSLKPALWCACAGKVIPWDVGWTTWINLGNWKLGWSPLLPFSSDTAWKCALLPWEKAKTKAREKGGQLLSPHAPSFPCCTSMRNGKSLTPARSASGLISSLLHILPQKWLYLFHRSNSTNFSMKYFKIICIWKPGICFPKEFAFSEHCSKLFLKEICNSLGNLCPYNLIFPASKPHPDVFIGSSTFVFIFWLKQ